MKVHIDKIKQYGMGWIKWTVLAFLCGSIVGPLGALFALGLDKATSWRAENYWLIYLLPFAGLLIVFLYRITKLPGGGSTNSVFMAVRDNKIMPFMTAPLIFVATIITQMFGGSAGREGAALQLGGSITGKIGQWLKLDDSDCRIMTMCGMAAAFAAVFGTPLAAAIFSLEVTTVGIMHYAALVPCLIAACLGMWISTLFGVHPHMYELTETLDVHPVTLLQTMLLAALVAILSIVVCEIFHKSHHLFAKYLKNPYLRVFIGGLLIVILTVVLGTTDYNGAGGAIIEKAVHGDAIVYAFLLKIVFTALTLGCGFKGGEIVPVLFIGSTFGCVVGPLLGIPATFGAAVGMIGLFCGATNCPIASIFLAIELFGGKSIPMFAITCAAAYMLSGYFGLYGEQKIMYSKRNMSFIDKKLG